MKIIFRADASTQIGTGHIMRCLTLADVFRENGGECQFVCRELGGCLIEYISSRGYKVHTLTKPDSGNAYEADLAHAAWLGVAWQTDVAQTRQAISSEIVDWLVVDHYALDHRWETALRPLCKRIMVIDDLADRRHNCDILLDQNYGSSVERYADLVPKECKQLHGPEFALLKPIYSICRAEQGIRNGKIERVLIYFGGGADHLDLTGAALQVFQDSKLLKVKLDIVIGSSYEHKEQLEALAATRGRANIHMQLPDLSELMARADLGIGASGATTWERCCLGLPSILVVYALNQTAIGEAMQRLGAAFVVFPNDNLIAEFKERVFDLCNDSSRYLKMSDEAKRICDGLGIQRVRNVFEDFQARTYV